MENEANTINDLWETIKNTTQEVTEKELKYDREQFMQNGMLDKNVHYEWEKRSQSNELQEQASPRCPPKNLKNTEQMNHYFTREAEELYSKHNTQFA